MRDDINEANLTIREARQVINRAYRAAEAARLKELVYRLGRVADLLDRAQDGIEYAAKEVPGGADVPTS